MELLNFPKVISTLRRALWTPLRVPHETLVSKGLSLYRYDSTGRLVHYDAENQEIEQDSGFTMTVGHRPDVEGKSLSELNASMPPSPRAKKRRKKAQHRRK